MRGGIQEGLTGLNMYYVQKTTTTKPKKGK